MLSINIDHGLKDIQRILNNMSNGIEKQAGVRALNRTMGMAKTAGKREMVRQYSFRSAKVESTLIVVKASPQRVEAAVRSRGFRTRLIDMTARQVKRGVTVRISNRRKLIRGAFIAKMKSGHVGVFAREPGMQMGKRGKPIKNRKIKELYTIAIPEAFGSQEVIDSMRQTFRDKFMARFKHEMEYLARTGQGFSQ